MWAGLQGAGGSALRWLRCAGSEPGTANVKLDPVQLLRRVLGLRPEVSERPRAASVHAERVTISPEGLEASRSQAASAHSDVRWYHAVKHGRVAGAQDTPGTGAVAGSSPLEARLQGARRPRAAIEAYLTHASGDPRPPAPAAP